MTIMQSIMAKAEDLLEHVTATTWTRGSFNQVQLIMF